MSDNQLTAKEEKHIWSFISDQTVLNLATSAGDEPWCASCFFAFEETNKLLVFKSDKESRHIKEALKQGLVAGSILPDKLKVGKVRGVQYQGRMAEDEVLFVAAKKRYYEKYPYAKVIPGDIWVIALSLVKLTDNTLGFGKKLIWHRE